MHALLQIALCFVLADWNKKGSFYFYAELYFVVARNINILWEHFPVIGPIGIFSPGTDSNAKIVRSKTAKLWVPHDRLPEIWPVACPDDNRIAIATLARKQNFKMKQIITRLEPREDKPIPNTPQGAY